MEPSALLYPPKSCGSKEEGSLFAILLRSMGQTGCSGRMSTRAAGTTVPGRLGETEPGGNSPSKQVVPLIEGNYPDIKVLSKIEAQVPEEVY